MQAELILDEDFQLGEGIVANLVIWRLPRQLRGSMHSFKYSLALVEKGVNVLRYDNEAGKGDHRHVGRREFAYRFVDLEELKIDFWKDVEEWLKRKSAS